MKKKHVFLHKNHTQFTNHVLIDKMCLLLHAVSEKGEPVERELDKRDNLRVVTANNFVIADGLATLSLNARKLLYIAIAQCRKSDKDFYEYSISPTDLAKIWGVSRQRIYQEADLITDELMRLFLKCGKDSNKKYFRKKHVFKTCEYDDENMITFELNRDMADLLLGLTGDFSQPLLYDFMRMRSKYTMAIWHIMQKEMHSTLPRTNAPIEFELSLQELREATNTEDKLKQISQFKTRVLHQAIREIRDNLLADITYEDIKKGHRVTGFRFTAANCLGRVDTEELSLRDRQRIRKAQLVRKKAEGTLSLEEKWELEDLETALYQMRIEDYYQIR